MSIAETFRFFCLSVLLFSSFWRWLDGFYSALIIELKVSSSIRNFPSWRWISSWSSIFTTGSLWWVDMGVLLRVLSLFFGGDFMIHASFGVYGDSMSAKVVEFLVRFLYKLFKEILGLEGPLIFLKMSATLNLFLVPILTSTLGEIWKWDDRSLLFEWWRDILTTGEFT